MWKLRSREDNRVAEATNWWVLVACHSVCRPPILWRRVGDVNLALVACSHPAPLPQPTPSGCLLSVQCLPSENHLQLNSQSVWPLPEEDMCIEAGTDSKIKESPCNHGVSCLSPRKGPRHWYVVVAKDFAPDVETKAQSQSGRQLTLVHAASKWQGQA